MIRALGGDGLKKDHELSGERFLTSVSTRSGTSPHDHMLDILLDYIHRDYGPSNRVCQSFVTNHDAIAPELFTAKNVPQFVYVSGLSLTSLVAVSLRSSLIILGPLFLYLNVAFASGVQLGQCGKSRPWLFGSRCSTKRCYAYEVVTVLRSVLLV